MERGERCLMFPRIVLINERYAKTLDMLNKYFIKRKKFPVAFPLNFVEICRENSYGNFFCIMKREQRTISTMFFLLMRTRHNIRFDKDTSYIIPIN